MTAEQDEAEKQKPLFEDIRLLGQILGDTVREQEGEEIYERIERIRRLSIAGKGRADSEAGRELDALLQSLSPAETASVIRAFAYFSHLANIAEDRHFLRRRAAHEPQTQPGGLAYSFERLRAAGVAPERIQETLAESYVSPVLTAHPTEVQRRSTLDAERAIADLLAARENCRTEADLRENEAQLYARVAQLWQTRILRTASLSVRDEIDNALALLPLDLHPRYSRALRRSRTKARAPGGAVLPHGQLDRRRPRRQSERQCGHARNFGQGPCRDDSAPLSGRGSPARRRIVDVARAGRLLAGAR